MNRISAPSCPGAASPPEGSEFQTMIRPKRDDHRTALIVLIRDALGDRCRWRPGLSFRQGAGTKPMRFVRASGRDRL